MNLFSTPHDSLSVDSDLRVNGAAAEPQLLDRTLTEIRSGRRLEKIAVSIESFLHNQISRIDQVLDQCRLAENNDKILQKILQDFEQEKLEWEEAHQAERLRLMEASEKLIQGWKQLEDERRSWLDTRDSGLVASSQ